MVITDMFYEVFYIHGKSPALIVRIRLLSKLSFCWHFYNTGVILIALIATERMKEAHFEPDTFAYFYTT